MLDALGPLALMEAEELLLVCEQYLVELYNPPPSLLLDVLVLLPIQVVDVANVLVNYS
jgi:hypothetical protein